MLYFSYRFGSMMLEMCERTNFECQFIVFYLTFSVFFILMDLSIKVSIFLVFLLNLRKNSIADCGMF